MADQNGIADLIKNIQKDVATIVHDEIELAKAELVPQVKAVGMGAGMFGAAGYVAMKALGLVFFGVAFLLSWAFSVWFGVGTLVALTLGFVVMAVLLLIVAGILALTGKGKFSFSKPATTIDSVEQSVAAVRTAIGGDKAARAAKALTPEIEAE